MIQDGYVPPGQYEQPQHCKKNIVALTIIYWWGVYKIVFLLESLHNYYNAEGIFWECLHQFCYTLPMGT